MAESSPLPWFPIYRRAWMESPAIAAMLPEQEGAYFRLLVIAWDNGDAEPSLPVGDTELATMSKLGARWKKLGASVRAMFVERDGRLYNTKLSEVWVEQSAKHAKASEKARVAANARALKKRLEDAASNASSNASGSAPSSASGTQNLEAVVSALNSAERQQPPSVAPAPEGARSIGASNGDYFASPSVREELKRRGFRPNGDDPSRSPTPLADAEADDRSRSDSYRAELSNKSSAWLVDHRDDAKAIGLDCRADLKLPLEGHVSPIQADSLRAAVVEVIRRREGWPTERSWDGTPFPEPTPGVTA